jgi:Big-like domain-containing protein
MGTLWVEGSATDDVGVVVVRLFVDGVLVHSATDAAFELPWTPSSVGEHLLQVVAEDAAGKTGVASTVVTTK